MTKPLKNLKYNMAVNHLSSDEETKQFKQKSLFPNTRDRTEGGTELTGNAVGKEISRLVGTPTMWFPNRSDSSRPVQLQKRARILKFRICVEEELYYPSRENKGADQLRGYREADLRLCFRICRLLVFP